MVDIIESKRKKHSWLSQIAFELEVIKESNKLLVSMYYSTRDLDLLVSLGILPNPVNCFSRKTSQSAKGMVHAWVGQKL